MNISFYEATIFSSRENSFGGASNSISSKQLSLPNLLMMKNNIYEATNKKNNIHEAIARNCP